MNMGLIIDFFFRSKYLDREVFKPLSHIKPNRELSWDKNKRCLEEVDSFATLFNSLLFRLEDIETDNDYHYNEDVLAEYVNQYLNRNIKKIGGRWTGDYLSNLEQGGFHDSDANNLFLALHKRIITAIRFNQNKYDNVEIGHRKMIGGVLAMAMYHYDQRI